MKPRVIRNPSSFLLQKVSLEVFNFLRIALRFLHLNLPSQWTQSEEKPKVALYHHRGIALIQSLIHIAPLCIVIACMVLNIRSYYWGSPSATILTTLQFATKFAEILTQASLANILLHLVRYQLLGQDGLPLGSLLGPYSITNVSYLWSLELWGGMTSGHIRLKQRLVLSMAIITTILLAALVGPSIAVLLIPRPIDSSIGQYLTLLDDEATLFPKAIGLDGNQLMYVITQIAHFVNKSSNSVGRNEEAFTDSLPQLVWEQNVDGHFALVYAGLGRTMQLEDRDSQNGTPGDIIPVPRFADGSLSTMPGYVDASAMWQVRWPAASNVFGTAKTRQPYVQVNCEDRELSNTENPDTTHISFPNIDPDFVSLSWAFLLDLVHNDTSGLVVNGTMNWRSPPPEASNHSLLLTEVLLGGDDGDASAVATAKCCVVDAIWASTMLNATLETEFTVGFSLAPVEAELQRQMNVVEQQRITLSADWAHRVTKLYKNVTSDLSNMKTAAAYALALAHAAPVPMIQGLGLKSILSEPGGEEEQDAMTQVQYSAANAYFKIHEGNLHRYNEVYLDTSINWTDPGSLFHLEVNLYRSGYGYDVASIPVQLSLAVVGIYAFIAIVHLVCTFVTGNVASSWDSFAELLMLGIKSPPPNRLLKGTNVGIETVGTFKEPLNVRVNEAGTVELVFRRDVDAKRNSFQRIVTNKAY